VAGFALIEVKQEVGHGGFLAWIEREFAWSEATAQRFMNATRNFPQAAGFEAGIEVTALYALAAPSTPLAARDAAIEAAQRGEVITNADADRMIAAATRMQRARGAAFVEATARRDAPAPQCPHPGTARAGRHAGSHREGGGAVAAGRGQDPRRYH
jgi:hypothetical protein